MSDSPRPDPAANPYVSPNSPMRQLPPQNADLTTVDWVIIVLCSGIGCILGLFRIVQGKPSGVKMLGFSILSMFIWTFIRIAVSTALRGAP